MVTFDNTHVCIRLAKQDESCDTSGMRLDGYGVKMQMRNMILRL
jgi:hypothetical protein